MDGRYTLHQARRAEDRLPPEQRPRYSTDDIRELVREIRADEPTGVSMPERDRESVHSIRTTWGKSVTKWAAGVILAGTLTGMAYGGCVGARNEMERAVTAQAAPIRERLDRIEPDIREILRRLPDKATQ